MNKKYTYQVLAETFINEGVEQCFALLGDANMSWASALADLGCKFIYTRDEHCAVAAAMAWGRSTGSVGVASVTCGPGVTQITTALPAAVRASIPLVVFAGETPLSKAWYNQHIEQRAFVEACGARYVSLHNIETMPLGIRDAFLDAKTNRIPVVIGVPFDLQESVWQFGVSLPAPSSSVMPTLEPQAPNPIDVVTASELIRSSNKTVLMAGLGAVDSGAIDACKSLAAEIGGLLSTTLPARGAFYDDDFCLGIAGGFSTDTARRCMQEADLVIAVGCSLAQHNSDSGKLFKAANVLHVDIKPLTLSQGRLAATHHIRCDAKLGIEAIVAHIQNVDDGDNLSSTWRSQTLADEIRLAPADRAKFTVEDNLHDPRDVVSALNTALPKDWYCVNSSGHCSYFFAQMPGRSVANFLTIREFGAIGNGIAFAIGASVANPDKTIVLFDGDGSLLMHVQELETIRRHGLNILICVLNDGAYGSEIHKMRAEGLNDEGAVFGRPDFAAIAQGFSLEGEVVRSLDQLHNKVDQLKAKGGAAIWDFHVSDKVVSPVIRRSHHH
jgi:thiamine pyrophosphate-dependent acetolactate synthase large subunit-like protein